MEITINTEDALLPLLKRLIWEVVGETPKQVLASMRCSDPALGRWIDNCDFPFLMETLALDDVVFKEEFPEIPASASHRREFAGILVDHCEACEHCQSKRASDLAWKAGVDSAVANDKKAIRNVLARTASKK